MRTWPSIRAGSYCVESEVDRRALGRRAGDGDRARRARGCAGKPSRRRAERRVRRGSAGPCAGGARCGGRRRSGSRRGTSPRRARRARARSSRRRCRSPARGSPSSRSAVAPAKVSCASSSPVRMRAGEAERVARRARRTRRRWPRRGPPRSSPPRRGASPIALAVALEHVAARAAAASSPSRPGAVDALAQAGDDRLAVERPRRRRRSAGAWSSSRCRRRRPASCRRGAASPRRRARRAGCRRPCRPSASGCGRWPSRRAGRRRRFGALQQRVVGRQRLGVGDVEPGAGDLAVVQRVASARPGRPSRRARVLMKYAVGFMRANCAAPIRCRVSSASAACAARRSRRCSSSSSSGDPGRARAVDDLHPEALAAARHRLADPAPADDPERRVGEVAAEHVARVPRRPVARRAPRARPRGCGGRRRAAARTRCPRSRRSARRACCRPGCRAAWPPRGRCCPCRRRGSRSPSRSARRRGSRRRPAR